MPKGKLGGGFHDSAAMSYDSGTLQGVPDEAMQQELPPHADLPDTADTSNLTGVPGGIEDDKEDPENTRIAHPFDPEKIKVRTMNVVIDQLVSRIRYEEIDLTPDFQRLRGIWKPDRKSRLVESLLLRIPLPVFYVAADERENWSVVDGIQRMSTIYDYVENTFPLRGLEYLTHMEGKTYDELPRSMRRRIGETQLVVNVIDPGTPNEVMFNIFHRINTGGMPLNAQEIRHALNPGQARQYLKNLAEKEEFLSATAGSIRPDRMADRDCVLRFLAFYIDGWQSYSVNDIDGYLDNAMKRINNMTQQELESLAKDFTKAMRAAAAIFEKHSFRKRYNPDTTLRRINKALFGAWSVALAQRPQSEIEILVKNKEKIQQDFMDTLNRDPKFDEAISYSTSTPARVRKQFETIEDLIERAL